MELLERKTQLVELNTALAEAVTGTGRVVLVSGEAGIGKTSLVEEFWRSHRESVHLLWGVCDSLFTPRPLGPLIDMVEQISVDILGLVDSESKRAQLFTAILGEFKRTPTIAVFEDIHWADEATLDLLRFLGRRISSTSTLLVLTYRDDELGPRHPLLTVLGDIGSSPAAVRIPLAPLSETAVRKLLELPGVDSAALHRQTGGNPFYITELLSNTHQGIPASIRDAVLARTARLSLSGLAVLEAAAVIGMRVDPWLLDVVTGSESAAIDESVQAGILLPQGESLVFRHDLTRQIILQSISPQRRPVLHRLVLEALRSSPFTRSDLTRLAHHAEGSGDYSSVLEYAPAAARQAATAGAHREAVALYGLVLRYAEHLDQAELAATLQAYGRECNVTEKQAQAITAQRKASLIWEQLKQPLQQADALATLAIMLRNNGENTEAERVNRAAIEILENAAPSRELALAYRVQATLSLSRRDNTEAIAWGERAIELARDFDDADIQAIAHAAVGSAWLFLDYERGRRYLEERIRLTRTTADPRYVANLYAYIGSSSVELYHFREAARYLAEGLAFTAERSLDIFRTYMLTWQKLAYIHLGQWEEADRASLQLLHNPSYPVISRIPALAGKSRQQIRRGDKVDTPVLNEAFLLAKQTGTLQYLGLVSAVRAEAAWATRDLKSVLSEVQDAFRLALEKKHPWFVGELAYWRWKAGDQVQLPDWAARPFALQVAGDWQQAAGLWEEMGCPYEQARALAEGDVEAKFAALKIFELLGAQSSADAARKTLQADGALQAAREPRPSTRQNPFGLTNRQMEILALLIENRSNTQIAARLHISPKTVDHHVSALLSKMGVHSREDAALLARQHPHFLK